MEIDATADPFALFQDWLTAARAGEPNDPEAMALATADADGRPAVRMVLLKDVSAQGFTFYSNAESDKGRALAANPTAALLFHWKSLRRQVRVEGDVTAVADADADAYFASRPRTSRIGAWASAQSRPLESRLALEKQVAITAARFWIGAIPRPSYWGGYRVGPRRIEFWQDGPFRLHDRFAFTRATTETPWTVTRLYP